VDRFCTQFAAVFCSIGPEASVLGNHTSKLPRETMQIDAFSRERHSHIDAPCQDFKLENLK
jgi:hypothetical protein